jgi:hypothetical protein
MARLTHGVMAGLALLVGAGCGLITGNDEEESALRRAELRWSRSAVQDYQVVVQNLCFCGYIRPVRITVRFGAVVSRVDAETGEPVPAYGHNVRDIAGLFDLIREAMAQDAYRLDVTYDPEYGFPTLIDIDYIQHAVDDELRVKTSEFQPMR